MILRKPFAILIKNFKRIHLILSLFAFYLVYKTNTILSFYNEYITSYTSVIGKDLTRELFHWAMYVSIFVILLGSIIILSLMVFKHKPVKLYIFNIIVYTAIIIVYILTYSVTSRLEIELVDVRTLKMVEDLLTSIFILQIISLCILVVRATGFNIKKFDFVKDLEDLEIEAFDNEEFEVNVDLDADKWKRKINRAQRHAKYVYKENKTVIWLLLFILAGIISTLIYINVGIYNKLYKKDEAFQTSAFTMKLADSYIINKDSKGDKIIGNEALVAILIDVKNNSSKEQVLDSARFVLKVKNHYFYHLPEYKEKVRDLGIAYSGQVVPSNFTKYMFIYKVPTGFLEDKMVLQYTDYTEKTIQMKVEPIVLDTEEESTVVNLMEPMDFSNSILGKTKFTLSGYYINRIMKVDYNYCIDNSCYPSSEYLTPTYTGRDRKALLFLQGSLEWDDNIPIQKMNDFSDLLAMFAQIKYTINGVEEVSTLPFKTVNPTKTILKNMCYIEVPEEIIYADTIKIVFHVRNKTYIYNVK